MYILEVTEFMMHETLKSPRSERIDSLHASRNRDECSIVAQRANTRPFRGLLDTRSVMQLQRTAGNAAIAKLLNPSTATGSQQAHKAATGEQDRYRFAGDTNQSAKTMTAGLLLPDPPGNVRPKWVDRGLGDVIIQRDDDLTVMCITPDYAMRLSDTELQRSIARLQSASPQTHANEASRENLGILLDEQAQRFLSQAAMPHGDIDPRSRAWGQYTSAVQQLQILGRQPSNDLEAAALPADRLLVIDEEGNLALGDPVGLVGVGDDLVPVLNQLADASEGGTVEPSLASGPSQQLLLGEDGRAVITPRSALTLPRCCYEVSPWSHGFLVCQRLAPALAAHSKCSDDWLVPLRHLPAWDIPRLALPRRLVAAWNKDPLRQPHMAESMEI
jgi:hypothetical protein